MSKITNFFTIPATEYTDLYEIARFKLTWNVNIAIFYAVAIFTVVTAIMAPNYLLVMLIALLFSATIIITIRVTRTYQIAAKLFLILAVLLSSSQLFLVQDMIHLVDLVWYITEVIFAYFVLGKKWGTVGLVCFTSSLIIYIFFMFDTNIVILQNNSLSIKAFQAINAVIGSLVLAYIIRHFIDTNRFAEYELQGINKNLNDQQVIIQNQNELNEVMIKEIHHRVKNNLQIIASLLKLQSFETDNHEVKKHFNEAIGRIRSMALIHEKMYSNDDLAKINLKNYLVNLTEEICQSLNAGDRIKLNIHSDLKKVDVKSMVPISLIFNELITNSLKHGFKNLPEGQIHIEIKSNYEKTEFHYTDNGKWIPPSKEGSFGLELMDTLTSQLDGTMERRTDENTLFIFRFNTETLFYR